MAVQVNLLSNEASIEIVREDGRNSYLRKDEINNVNVSLDEIINYSGTTSGNPFSYKLYIDMANGKREEIELKEVDNQPTWTEDLTGLNKAASDIAQAIGLDSDISSLLAQILAAIQAVSEYEAKLVVDNNDVTWLEVRIYNTGSGTFDPPIYLPVGSNTPGTPAPPINYINPNTYLAQIVSNTSAASNLTNSITDLQNTSGTFGSGERSYSILLELGTATIDGVSFTATDSKSYVFKFGTDNNNTQSGVSYDATSDPSAIIYGSIG